MTGLDQYDNIDLLELDVTKPDTIKVRHGKGYGSLLSTRIILSK